MFNVLLIYFLFSLTFLGGGANQTSPDLLAEAELKLQELLVRIAEKESISQRNSVNKEFISKFHNTLQIDGAFNYPFDSLRNIGKLKSPDDRIRIFTWNIPQYNNNHKYFGFILANLGEEIRVIPLYDKREDYENPHKEITTHYKWHGALYYHIQQVELNGQPFYTLLGVDLNNLFSTKRIIEVLHFNEKSDPTFGHPVFRVRNQIVNRIILEYSARANLLLRWEEDHGMIVFNHLTPLRRDLVGNFQYYVPDLSFDGFRFEHPHWVYIADVDIRNPERDRPPTPIAPPSESAEPGFLYRSGRN